MFLYLTTYVLYPLDLTETCVGRHTGLCLVSNDTKLSVWPSPRRFREIGRNAMFMNCFESCFKKNSSSNFKVSVHIWYFFLDLYCVWNLRVFIYILYWAIENNGFEFLVPLHPCKILCSFRCTKKLVWDFCRNVLIWKIS